MRVTEDDTVHVGSGFFLKERDDGSFVLLDEGDVVCEGDSIEDALETFHTMLELRLCYATMAWMQSCLPDEGRQA